MHSKASALPVCQLQRWRKAEDRLLGQYRTPTGSWEGYVLYPDTRRPQFFIRNPPPELRQDPRWRCFHPKGEGVYLIHFSPTPTSTAAGILEIERILAEAIAEERRQHALQM